MTTPFSAADSAFGYVYQVVSPKALKDTQPRAERGGAVPTMRKVKFVQGGGGAVSPLEVADRVVLQTAGSLHILPERRGQPSQIAVAKPCGETIKLREVRALLDLGNHTEVLPVEELVEEAQVLRELT